MEFVDSKHNERLGTMSGAAQRGDEAKLVARACTAGPGVGPAPQHDDPSYLSESIAALRFETQAGNLY